MPAVSEPKCKAEGLHCAECTRYAEATTKVRAEVLPRERLHLYLAELLIHRGPTVYRKRSFGSICFARVCDTALRRSAAAERNASSTSVVVGTSTCS